MTFQLGFHYVYSRQPKPSFTKTFRITVGESYSDFMNKIEANNFRLAESQLDLQFDSKYYFHITTVRSVHLNCCTNSRNLFSSREKQNCFCQKISVSSTVTTFVIIIIKSTIWDTKNNLRYQWVGWKIVGSDLIHNAESLCRRHTTQL